MHEAGVGTVGAGRDLPLGHCLLRGHRGLHRHVGQQPASRGGHEVICVLCSNTSYCTIHHMHIVDCGVSERALHMF